MKFISAALACSALLFVACSPKTEEKNSDTQAIFGKDYRSHADSNQTPYAAVVRIALSNGQYCSGALVGRDIVLTASSCLNITGSFDYNAKIQGQFKNGSFQYVTGISDAWEGLYPSSKKAMDNFAIIRTQIPIGDSLGWFGMRPNWIADWTYGDLAKVNLASYHDDNGQVIMVQKNCNIKGSEDNLYLHDCATMAGSAGAPLYQVDNNGIYLIGINGTSLGGNQHYAAYNHNIANRAVKSEAFFDFTVELLNNRDGIYDHRFAIFCNHSREKAWIAFGWWENNAWQSAGWWTIERNQCMDFDAGPHSSGLYYYAVDDKGGEWKGDLNFCGHKTNKFNAATATNGKNCPAGLSTLPMRKAFDLYHHAINRMLLTN